MKAIVTLFLILTSGAIALANTEGHVEVDRIEVGVVLGSGIDASQPVSDIKAESKNNLTRLYKFKNSRIKNALTFEPKGYDAKLV